MDFGELLLGKLCDGDIDEQLGMDQFEWRGDRSLCLVGGVGTLRLVQSLLKLP